MSKEIKEGKAFHLLEMEDSMEEAIKNAEKVKTEQLELVEVIKNSDKADKFKDFIDESEEQIKEIDNQINKLNIRLNALKFVNNYPEKEIIEKLIITLGLFE